MKVGKSATSVIKLEFGPTWNNQKNEKILNCKIETTLFFDKTGSPKQMLMKVESCSMK